MACSGDSSGSSFSAFECSDDTHLAQHCNLCRNNDACALTYDITYHATDACTTEQRKRFSKAYLLFYKNTYNRGFCGDERVEFCDTRDGSVGSKAHFSKVMYSVYGPACQDSEVFKVYGSNGFCYCGDGCDKTYNNPLLDHLLGALILLLVVHILFNFSSFWHKTYWRSKENAKDQLLPASESFTEKGIGTLSRWTSTKDGAPVLGGRNYSGGALKGRVRGR